jgi:hypothetical protein
MSTAHKAPRRRAEAKRGRAGVVAVTASLAIAAAVAYGLSSFLTESSRGTAGQGGDTQYGLVAGTSDPVRVAEALAKPSAASITLTGTVVEMGPTMGCWLVIDDGSGKVLVQTDPMTFVDQSVKGQTITATGKMTVLDGGMGFSGKRPALVARGITVLG